MTSDRQTKLERARARWHWRGQQRPEFAAIPGPGQESVWDYPRPPKTVRDHRRVEVRGAGREIARSIRSVRVLETAGPPTFYLPPDDVRIDRLVPAPGHSICEWKGEASYLALRSGEEPVAWFYSKPFEGFESIAGWIAFYPGRVECSVAGGPVRPQPGGFYGGWVTDELVGPFKGEPGTEGW